MAFSKKRSVVTRIPPSAGPVEFLRAPTTPVTLSLDRRFQIRPIRPGEIDQALLLLLTDTSDSPREAIERKKSFQQLAHHQQYDLTKQIVVLQDDKLISASLFVPQPGGVAFVFQSPLVDVGSDRKIRESAIRALQEMCVWAFQESNSLLQVIIEPDDIARQELCREGGFKLLTDLRYMIHDNKNKTSIGSDKTNDWLCYDRSHHDLFQKIIMETYQGSRDCPELEDIRDIEDVVSSHRASGKFDYNLWKLLIVEGNPVGVLLLIPLPDQQALELTYMGLCPQVRGKHLGEVLIGEALACTEQYQCRFLTLAVDQRNHFAYRLYDKFGFEEILQRTVLIYSLPK